MRVVLDSCVWIELLTEGPRTPDYRKALDDLESLVVPTICLTEVHRFVARTRGEEQARATSDSMRQGKVAALDAELALESARQGQGHGLSLADSIVYATARSYAAQLWTQDADFKDLPGVRYFPKKKA